MKSAIYKSFANDKSLEVTGVQVFPTSETNEDGTKPSFTIRRAGGRNADWQKALDRVTEPRRDDLEAKTVSPEDRDAMEAQIFVEGILVTWDNVQDEKGENIPYTERAAIELFTALPDLRQKLNIMAAQLATFRAKQREENSKN